MKRRVVDAQVPIHHFTGAATVAVNLTRVLILAGLIIGALVVIFECGRASSGPSICPEVTR